MRPDRKEVEEYDTMVALYTDMFKQPPLFYSGIVRTLKQRIEMLRNAIIKGKPIGGK